MTAAQFGDYLRGYDDIGLAAAAVVPERLRAAAARCDVVVHSPLRRAVETVSLLDKAVPRQVWPELIEAAQPAPAIRGVRLPLDGWDVLTRVGWLLGRPGPVEPSRAAPRWPGHAWWPPGSASSAGSCSSSATGSRTS